MEDDWCNEKFSELRVPELRLAALKDIQNKICIQSPEGIDTIVGRFLSSLELFRCLRRTDEVGWEDGTEIIKLANEIITACLNKLMIDTRQPETATILRLAMKNSQSNIRSEAFNCLLKELRKQASICEVQPLPSDDLLLYSLDELRRQETMCGVSAISILTIVLPPRIKETQIHELLLAMLKDSDVVRCRLYELAVKIARTNVNNLNSIAFIIDAAIAELDNDDVLLQANILEILVQLAEQNHGLVFMERRRVFDVISERIKHLEQNPLDNMLVPSIMKFFGKIARTHPEKMIGGYKHMVMCLFDSIHSGDVNLLPAAMDTLANLADSQQGKLLIDEMYSISIRDVFETYGAHLKNMAVDLKIRLFHTLAAIYLVEETVLPEVSEVLKKWLRYLTGSSKVQILLDYCRTPFPDLKIACLAFIKVFCNYPWGVEAVKKTAGFVEYLLDRRLESDKDVKYLKWEVISRLADSNSFDVQVQLQLTRYVNDGPYYATSEMNVAVEGGD